MRENGQFKKNTYVWKFKNRNVGEEVILMDGQKR